MSEKRRLKAQEQSDFILSETAIELTPEIDGALVEQLPVQPPVPVHKVFGDPEHATTRPDSNTPIPARAAFHDAGNQMEYSELSHADLTDLAKHPNASESDWLQACLELNRRDSNNTTNPRMNRISRRLLPVAGVILLSLISTVALLQLSPMSNLATWVNLKQPVAPYVLSSAQYQSDELLERACIRLAQSIDERAWSYTKAAKYLDVSEGEISNLMRGAKTPFSMQALNKLLFAMGESTVFPPTLDHKELQRTIAYFTRLITIAPTNSRAIAGRASAYESLKQYDLAIADFRRLVVLEPHHHGPRQNLAWAYKSAGRYEQALQELNQLHDLFPQDDIYQNRALVFSAMGKYNDAIADCTRSIQMMEAQRPGPYWNRALDYEKLGKYPEAIADCKKVLEIDPNYSSAVEQIAILKTKMQS